MRVTLRQCPQVVRLASAFNADKCPLAVRVACAIGFLQITWSLFDQQARDGVLAGYTPEALDLMVGFEGWTSAMQEVGWIAVTPAGIELYDWQKHNGTSAKRRLQEAERKRAVRKQCGRSSASDADAERTPSVSVSVSESVSGQGEPEREALPAPPPSLVCRVIERELEQVPEGIRKSLDAWAVHRREIGKPLGASALRAALAEARRDPEAFARRVRASVLSGTTVLMEDREAEKAHADLTARQRDQLRAHESHARLEAILHETLTEAAAAHAANPAPSSRRLVL